MVYVCLLPPEKRYDYLRPILQAICDRYKRISKKIELDVKPRFNRQVKDFVYIASGEGMDKRTYYKAPKDCEKRVGKEITKKLFDDQVYTEDGAFFKQYDIDEKSLLKIEGEKPPGELTGEVKNIKGSIYYIEVGKKSFKCTLPKNVLEKTGQIDVGDTVNIRISKKIAYRAIIVGLVAKAKKAKKIEVVRKKPDQFVGEVISVGKIKIGVKLVESGEYLVCRIERSAPLKHSDLSEGKRVLVKKVAEKRGKIVGLVKKVGR